MFRLAPFKLLLPPLFDDDDAIDGFDAPPYWCDDEADIESAFA